MRRLALITLCTACLLAVPSISTGQEPGEQVVPGGGRGQMMGMQRVGGEVTAVAADSITVKAEDGTLYKVVATANTRLMKGQGTPLKLADLKPGDGVMAAGNMDAPNKTLHAALVFATDAEQVKKLKENLGKTYIAGKITAIDADNLKLTILRADNVSQTIGLDESTSFKRGGMRGMRGGGGSFVVGAGGAQGGADAAIASATQGGESITLADIKVGDNVAGTGAMKSGLFVPTQLNVMSPRPRRAPGADTPAPAATTPKP